MTVSETSDNLLDNYLEWIRAETGRPIEIKEANVAIPQLEKDPSSIIVVLPRGSDKTNLDTQRWIAHEATHGLLLYARGYADLKPKKPLDTHDQVVVGRIKTMIDDIVVNRLIQQAGFPAFDSYYIKGVEHEAQDARKGKDFYSRRMGLDPSLKEIQVAFDYVMAWGFRECCELEFSDCRAIKKLLKELEAAYPGPIEKAKKITAIILKNGIFQPDGQRATLEEVVKLWNLDDRVEVKIE